MSRVAAFFYSRHLPSPPFALLTAMANASQECLHPRCDVKFRDVKDGDVAYLGEWMSYKGGATNLIGEPNFRSRRLEWRDVQGAICKYDGQEVLEEKERALEQMGHAKGPDFTLLANQRHSFVCVSPLQPQQYHVDDNQRRCLSHGANVRKDLEVALDNYCATTSHPAAQAARPASRSSSNCTTIRYF